MDSYETGRIFYLALLGLAIGGYYIAANRENLGQMVRQALLWLLIFVGAVAVAGLWDDVSRDVAPRQSYIEDGAGGRIEVPMSPDGHYHLTLGINGTPVRFVVDTGASDIVLSAQDARRVGINPDTLAYLGRADTANGTVAIARVMLDTVSLGGITDHGVAVSVNGGEMFGSLLGMSYLSRFGRIEIADRTLVLER